MPNQDGRREGRSGLFFHTEAVSLGAITLKPNGRYIIRGKYTEDTAVFSLEDEDTKGVVATSNETPILIRNTGMMTPQSGGFVPIIIPSRR